MVVERKVGEEDGDLKMEIRLIDNSKPLINVYLFKQIDISLCNAIRRTIIRSIPVLAVEDVEIYTNESALISCQILPSFLYILKVCVTSSSE